MKPFLALVLGCALLFSRPCQAQTPLQNSHAVWKALRLNDTRALSRFVDAKTGLRISPYVFAQKSDLTFSPRQVAKLRTDTKPYRWGNADGSGDPIRLTWNRFHKTYLDAPLHNRAPRIGINRPVSRGNTRNNLAQFYKGATLVEFHVAAPKSQEMAWRGVWMAWKKVGKSWRLVGLAGDQWTI